MIRKVVGVLVVVWGVEGVVGGVIRFDMKVIGVAKVGVNIVVQEVGSL